ncbi:28S ribosomal protein S25, mitochondrial-like [Hydractinia symbiolongicarpus]|uniref:28S ribosomal protein S25, mitochondrial-like n=1 Tax=Hydractinia symbiolongicarpus TaxID=13093 RepID=UPI00254ECCD3|nr:28S ribosomal protein S25, mitochondrial-like [Hydractinia symbiolongicarpus]
MAKGKFPFRRTIEFLNSGRTILQKRVKTVSVSFTTEKASKGLRDFVLRDLPRVQYKNPTKQFVCFRNKDEYPHLTLFYDGGERQLIDVYNKSADEILSLLDLAAAATESEILQKQEVKYPGRLNPANFGKYGHCFCICEKPGQVPCPSRVKFDKTPKWWHNKEESQS